MNTKYYLGVDIGGKAGAVVRVSYTTPGGASKTLTPVTLPESGIYRLSVPLTEHGSYTFSALSTLPDEPDATAEKRVESISSTVSPVTGFRVVNGR